MRATAAGGVALVGLLSCLNWSAVEAHPLCYFNDRQTDPSEELTFCPPAQDGACCKDDEEAMVQAIFEEAGALTPECADYYKQVVCGVCGSYSAHLYEILGSELGTDGLMMKMEFCTGLVTACAGQITFKTYDGVDYCTKHTGGGKTDLFWSYPYEEAGLFESGLTPFFDSSVDITSRPVSMKMSPDGSVFWIVGLAGQLVEVDAGSMKSSKLVMDVSDKPEFALSKEEGLLDIAFGPIFHTNARFYASYSVKAPDGIHNRLSKFEYNAKSAALTLGSEEILLESTKRSSKVHTAGWLGFKPSDYYSKAGAHDLYWSVGDSGPQEDPDNHGQNPKDLHGTIVRIQVPTKGAGYDIPAGNYEGGLPEICAIGFRNPWRCSFDKETDELYCGDVGQTRVEVVNIIECGKNYGWAQFEGSRCQEAVEDRFVPCSSASRAGVQFPWFEYCHSDYFSDAPGEKEFTDGVDICGSRAITGFAVIGGFVYRGQYLSDVLSGAYVFGDNQNKNLYYIRENGAGGKFDVGTIVSDASISIIAFAEDNAGELYAITNDAQIYPLPCGDLCASSCVEQADETPSFESLGCFTDSTPRALTLSEAPDCGSGERAMSPSICASYCATVKGAVYFGVEFSYECFCGSADDEFDKYGSLPSGACNSLCTAFPDETCGGKLAIEVYSLGDAPPPPAPVTPVAPETPDVVTVPDYTMLGCFVDNIDRTLKGTFFPKSTTLTTETCAIACDGSVYFATENGNECICGEAGDDYDAFGDATNCDKPCSGDADQTCGGFFAANVYLYGDIGPEPAPPAIFTPEGYTYMGCYADNIDDRVLTGDVIKEDPTMESEGCAQLCKGKAYFGTQYGNECWCGEATDDFTRFGPGVCNFDCEGDDKQKCGGRNSISIYALDSPAVDTTPTSSFGYLGCFVDNKNRVLSGKFIHDEPDMSVMKCALFCEGVSTYFGLQNADECFCGASTDSPDMLGEATNCDAPCVGDGSETCGGTWAMSTYQFDGAPVEAAAPPASSGFVGCFADQRKNRMFQLRASVTNGMKFDVCQATCEGFAYFGLQYGTECWCGDAETNLDSYAEGDCDRQCSGDLNGTCGGFFSMDVYAY